MLDRYSDYQYCDLHHLIILLILTCAIIATLGIGLITWHEFQQVGLEIFKIRPNQLGDYRHFELAYIFNGVLLITSTCMFLAMLGLVLLPLGWLSKLLAIVGIYTSITIFLMGVFPMNLGRIHLLASFHYSISITFLSCMSLLAGVLSKPYCSKWLMINSFLLLLACIVNLSHLDVTEASLLSEHARHYQDCIAPYFSWGIAILNISWDVALAFTIRQLIISHFVIRGDQQLAGIDPVERRNPCGSINT
ncbi:hypothetical protein [Shewanella sp. NIFS-20-20]|uniref:hypothetical protein n=1 Tax=Shewanella sp. NIFS-20-20 TaxID=2853806 RepID=UPI001C43B1C9|nr:hypothetical protein [Shewanella sp. NIFS-20-20]MBV7314119.1 hypothetical protein [Shewanella sp. NIFS-20-20]